MSTRILDDSGIKFLLEAHSAIIKDSHFVYTEPKGHGDHGDAYVNKDALYPDPDAVSTLCYNLALRLKPVMDAHNIKAVVGPEKGGIILSQWLTYHLNELHRGIGDERIHSTYAEKASETGFVLRRGYDKLVRGGKVIVVEDILNSGGSAADAVTAVRNAGGDPIAVAAICNRGKVTAEQLGVGHLVTLISVDLKKYSEESCPICAAGLIPVRTDLGHGAGFLARKNKTA